MALGLSKRQAALTDLLRRLAFIQVKYDYNTDAGLNIVAGEAPRFGPDDPPYGIAVILGDETPTIKGGLIDTRWPIQVQALVRNDVDQPYLTAEAIIADIREAVEIEATGAVDRFLGVAVEGRPFGTLPRGLERGVTRSIPRAKGSDFVGASQEYVLTIQDKWGGEFATEDT